MTEELAFLDAIRAAPHDDAPRLIYADWLGEQFDDGKIARGEFIRTQIERETAAKWSPEWLALWERERALLKRFGSTWKAPFESRNASVVEWHKGLPSRLSLSPDVLAQHGSLLAELAPSWRALHLTTTGPNFARVLASAPPSNVVEFSFGGPHLTRREVGNIAASPWLEQAERLSLAGARLGLGLEPVLAAAAAKRSPLKALSVAHNAIDPHVAQEFAGDPRLRPLFESLHELDLSGNRLGDGVGPWLAACRPGVLKSLHLHGVNSSFNYNRFPALDFAGLVSAPTLLELEELTFSDNMLASSSVSLFAALKRATKLRRLELRQTPFSPADLEAVTSATAEGHEWPLLALGLAESHQTALTMGWLARQSLLRNVRVLDLSGNEIRDVGATALAESSQAARLRAVNVANNHVTAIGAAALRGSAKLPQFVKLVTRNDERSPFFD